MQTVTRWAMLLVLVACQYTPPPEVPDEGGQSGTAMPPHCVEDSRVTVTDPTVPAEGFDFSASDVIAPVEGIWRGEGVLEGGSLVTVETTVAWEGGLIEAVLTHYEEGSGEIEALGAPDTAMSDCPPVYELGFALDVAAPPWLTVSGTARLAASVDLGMSIPIEVDESDVTGDLEPPEWDNPQYWDRTSLSAVFQQYGGASSLDLQWWAINDDPAQSTGDPTTTPNGGQVSTSYAEPSGTASPIAFLQDLTRLP